MNRLISLSSRFPTVYSAGGCRQSPLALRMKKTLASEASNETALLQGKPQAALKITLLAPNQNMTVTSLKEAQKLAKRRELHLVQVQEVDSKSHRPIYKLVTTAEMLSDEIDDSQQSTDVADKSAEIKSEKALTIGSRISEHDLTSRLKQITKWLAKRHKINILVQGNADEMSNSERIVKTIEQCIKEPEINGRIVQKRTKGTNIKFNILPVDTKKQPNTKA